MNRVPSPEPARSVTPTQIVLADPYLVGASGHCYPYLEAVRECLARQGRGSVIVGNRAAPREFLAAHRARGEFYSVVREWRPSNILFGAIFRRNLSAIARAQSLDGSSLLVLNSLRPFHLAPLAKWLARRRKSERPKVACILHFAPRTSIDERQYREGFASLAALPAESGFRLLADTTELQQGLGALGAPPIGLTPIPSSCGNLSAAARTEGPIRLAFVGEARWDKGFDLLPAAAEAIAGRPHLQAELIVQSFNPEPKTPSFLATLQALRERGAKLIDEPLSVAAYGELIQGADILLMPYSAPHYRFQSSGVFVDALLAGKVTVAPTASWMGKHIASHGGGSLFDELTPEGFREAVGRALDRFAELKHEAEANAPSAKAFHNAENLTKVLIEGVTATPPL